MRQRHIGSAQEARACCSQDAAGLGRVRGGAGTENSASWSAAWCASQCEREIISWKSSSSSMTCLATLGDTTTLWARSMRVTSWVPARRSCPAGMQSACVQRRLTLTKPARSVHQRCTQWLRTSMRSGDPGQPAKHRQPGSSDDCAAGLIVLTPAWGVRACVDAGEPVELRLARRQHAGNGV